MRTGAIWLLILMLAFVNGAARELFLIPWLGRAPGLFLGGILLSTVIFVLAFASVQVDTSALACQRMASRGLLACCHARFRIRTGLRSADPPGEMLGAYSFRDGSTWLLVVLTTMIAPRLAYGWRRRVGPEHVA